MTAGPATGPDPIELFGRAVAYIGSLRPGSRPDRVHALAALGANDNTDDARESFWHAAHLVAVLQSEIHAAPPGCHAFARSLARCEGR